MLPAVRLRRVRLPWRPTRAASNGRAVWILSRDAAAVARLDASSPALSATATLPATPYWAAATDEALYVSVEKDGAEAVLRLDPESLAVEARRSQPAFALTISPGRVWVANIAEGPSFVTPHDFLLRPALRRVEVAQETVALASAGERVFALSHDAAQITVIEASTGRVLDRYQLKSEPHMLVAGLGSLWVASYHTNEVIRLGLATGQEEARIALPFAPEWMAVDQRDLWVLPATGGAASDAADHRIARVDGSSNELKEVFDLGGKGTAIAWAGGRLWVPLEEPSEVVVFAP